MRPSTDLRSIVKAAAFCSVISLATALLFSGRAAAVPIPYLFIIVVVFAAARWSSIGAVLGLLIAVLLFSTLMYPPIGTTAVASNAARLNLSLMVGIGVASSYLFSRSPQRH